MSPKNDLNSGMGSKPKQKPQEVVAVAAAPKASVLDAQLTAAESEMAARKKRGAAQNIYAGAGNQVSGAEVLG